jgi:D-3-phosphoglycerate dehydrogenase
MIEMKRCRIISRFGIGVDNVDLDAATAAGIVVTSARLLHRRSVRSCDGAPVGSAQDPVVKRSGARRPMGDEVVVPIHRLRGRVLGLVGFGRIRSSRRGGRSACA